ncbi:hypothetical protein NP493_151g04006 [Ridgeia piscesae]|uniref:Uncharacterized protein n=1 Tax=Ridgeia piscesae TaxID=27915 RepID=A0AAD9P4B5_RIDPI|nr:hypothetical protein NP493_151g04006 [Ridgeia piscesae]
MGSLATAVVIVVVMVYFFLIYIFTINFADSGNARHEAVKPSRLRMDDRAVRYRRRYSDANYDVYDIADSTTGSEDEDCVYFLFPDADNNEDWKPRPTVTRKRSNSRYAK